MRSYLAAFVQALVLCVVLTPAARWLALRLGAVSIPGGRHHHQLEIPRLGGIAIAFSALAPVLTLLYVDSGVALFIRQRIDLVLGLLICGLAMCALGALDDIRGLRARTKLTVQLSAALLAYFVGFRIDGLMLPFFGPVALGYLGLPLTLLWIVGVTNAVNLIDGLDGLAAGVVFFAAVSNLVVALMSGSQTETVFVALLMVSLMGAVLGFLFFNFNPARVFMGDSGSYFLGFVLATTSLMAPLQKASTAVSLLVPIVALGLPIFDTLFSMLRRYLARRPLFSADRGHIHHRLLDMGITHRRAVITLYVASVVLALSAIAIALGRDWEIGLGLLGACTVVVGLIRAVGLTQFARQRFPREGSDVQADALRLQVPALLERMRSNHDREPIAATLEQLRQAAGVAAVALVPRAAERTHVGEAGPFADEARFPIGADQGYLLLCDSRMLDLSPQAEVLVQLVADQFARAPGAPMLPVGEAGSSRFPAGAVDHTSKDVR